MCIFIDAVLDCDGNRDREVEAPALGEQSQVRGAGARRGVLQTYLRPRKGAVQIRPPAIESNYSTLSLTLGFSIDRPPLRHYR